MVLDRRTGNPVAVQGPELPAVLAGDRIPNNGSSSDAVNAPQTAQEWLSINQPDYRESGRTFGAVTGWHPLELQTLSKAS